MKRPAYLTKREEAPQLDETVEVAESDVDGDEEHICRIAKVVAPELDCLSEQEDPSTQEYQ